MCECVCMCVWSVAIVCFLFSFPCVLFRVRARTSYKKPNEMSYAQELTYNSASVRNVCTQIKISKITDSEKKNRKKDTYTHTQAASYTVLIFSREEKMFPVCSHLATSAYLLCVCFYSVVIYPFVQCNRSTIAFLAYSISRLDDSDSSANHFLGQFLKFSVKLFRNFKCSVWKLLFVHFLL